MVRLTVVAVLVFLAALPLVAQAPTYDGSAELTLRGSVLYVADSASGAGLYAIMKDGNNEIEVYLAPASFLATAGIEVKVGDTIKVVGSRTHWKGGEVILARELTAGSRTLALRTATGDPRW